MGSIYSNPVSYLLRHLQEGALERRGGSRTGGSFADLLGKVSAGKETPKKVDREPEPTNEAAGPLTNLTPLENEVMSRKAGEAAKAPPPPLATSVNTTETPVNIPPPRPVLPAPRLPSSQELLQRKVAASYRQSPGREVLQRIISDAGRVHGIDPNLSLAVAKAESNLKPDAVSRDGHASKGLFQLLDSTAHDLIGRMKVKESYQPFNPEMNAKLGVSYLRRLHDIFSRRTELTSNLVTVPVKSAVELEKVAVAAFNAGEGNVARAQHRAAEKGLDPSNFDNIEPYLPASTRAYVDRVTNIRSRLAGDDDDTMVG